MAARQLRPSPESLQPAARRAYGYCRCSTDMQADSGIGLDEQERKIRARAAEMGWHLEHVYVDAGVSGGMPLGKRPEGTRLLSVVQPGEIVISSRMIACSAARSTRSRPSTSSGGARSRSGSSTWAEAEPITASAS